MSLREWLIAIGTLVILGIVIDGVRRMRRARKESMAISSGMGADDLKDSPLDDDYNPELPNGGARTVSRGTLEERGYLKRDTSEDFGSSGDDDVMLESGWGATDDNVDDGVLGEPRVVNSRSERSVEPPAGEATEAYDDEVSARPASEPELPPEPEPAPEPAQEPKSRPAAKNRAKEPPVLATEVEEDTARREAAPGPRKNQPLAGANRPDMKLLGDTLDAIVIARPEPTAEQPQHLCGDKGYDYRETREAVRDRGYIPHIRARGEEQQAQRVIPGYRPRRWVVEVTHSWLNRFRKLLVRFEKRLATHLGLLQLACATIVLRRAGSS